MRTLLLLILVFLTCPIFGQVLKVHSEKKNIPIEFITIQNPCNGKIFTAKSPFIQVNTFECDSIILSSTFHKGIVYNVTECKLDTCIIVLSPTVFKLPEISIVSDRIGIDSEKILSGIKIFKSEEINKGSNGSTADALEKNGIFVQKSQGAGGSPIIRGFEANKILLSVDGIRMNNGIYRAGHLQNAISIPKAFLQSVEVLEGGGATIHGSDALGGVIAFRTRIPQFSEKGSKEMKVEYSLKGADADSSYSGSIILSANNEYLSSITGFSTDKFGNLRQGAKRGADFPDFGKRPWYVVRINNVDSIFQNKNENIQVGSDYSQLALMQKISLRTAKESIHQLNLQYNRSSDADFYSRLTETDAAGKPQFAEWYYGPLIRGFASYEFRKQTKFSLVDEILIGVNTQIVEESRHSRRFNKTSLDHRTEKLNIIGLNADFIKKHEKSAVHYGIDARHETIYSKAEKENIVSKHINALNTRYPDGGSKITDIGIYTSADHKLSETFAASGGIRLNIYQLEANFNDTTFFRFPFNKINSNNSSLNGNAGLAYNKDGKWGSSIMLESGIRSPNLDDIAKVFDSKAGTVVLPNPELEAERTIGPALKIWSRLSPGSKIELNTFYLKYDNIITYSPGKYEGKDSILYDGINSAVLTLQNKDEAYITGITLSTEIKINSIFNFSYSSTYTYGRIKTDSTDYPLDHIPPFYGSAIFTYSKKRVNLITSANFAGNKLKKDYNIFGEDNFRLATPDGLKGYVLLGLTVDYKFNQHLNIEAGIENITDKNYRTFASGISGAGRTIYFGIKGKL